MGVYIDMEMPKDCCECPLTYYGTCIFTGIEALSIGIQKDCPLVTVPPHGDLIDKDAYRDEFMNSVYALCSDDSDNYRANAIIDLFDVAPTVIEAEEDFEKFMKGGAKV